MRVGCFVVVKLPPFRSAMIVPLFMAASPCNCHLSVFPLESVAVTLMPI